MGTVLCGNASAAISPPPPSPQDGTTFDLFVSDVAAYDDNLYRVPSDFGSVKSVVAPEATKGDFLDTVSAGGTGQYIVGLQDFDLTLRADYTRFLNNTQLNNTGGDALGQWNWSVGSHFSGTAGAEFNRSLASFAETRYLGRDSVDNKDYFGSARWQVGPRWAVFGGVRLNDIDHGAAAAEFNNFKTKTGNVGVEYATGLSNTFGLEYRYADGTYPSNYTFDGVLFDRNFKEDTYRGNIKYVITEKTQLDAYAGYMKHTLPSDQTLNVNTFGNFSGDVWRVSLNWVPTEKTQVLVSGWHELHAYLVNASNYFISKGFSIAPQWQPREKLTVVLVLSRENQYYTNLNTALAAETAPRFDRVTGEQINVFYAPRDKITVNLFFRNEKRSSNEDAFTYNDRIINLSAIYKFW